MSDVDTPDFHSRPSKRAADDNVAAGGKRNRSGKPSYLEQLKRLRDDEAYNTTPVTRLADNFFATVNYWVGRKEIQLSNRNLARPEEVEEHDKEGLHVLQRLYCILQKFNADFKAGWPEKQQAQLKLTTFKASSKLRWRLKTVRDTIMERGKASFANPYDLGIDSHYNKEFREFWDRLGEDELKYVDDEVDEMTFEEQCGAAAHVLSAHSRNKYDLEERVKQWAHVFCLHRRIEGGPPQGSNWPERVKNWTNADSGFKIDLRRKEQAILQPLSEGKPGKLDEKAKKKLLEACREINPFDSQILKEMFEKNFNSGKSIDVEVNPHISVTHFDGPSQLEDALKWFVNRDDNKLEFGNDAAQRAGFLRDWKRVLALKQCVKDSDEVSGNDSSLLLKNADKKIEEYADRVKELPTRHSGATEQMNADLAATKGRDTEFDGTFIESYKHLLNNTK